MHHFHYRNDRLFCENVSLEAIAAEVGTPFYCYSHATLSRHFVAFDDAFADVDHLTCFSVKSCSNIAVLRLFASLGAGMDIVSGGELYRALQAGVAPEKIVFSGVGKTEEEITFALEQGILMFNVESAQEMAAVNSCARRLGCRAPVAIRVNPDVDPRTHPYIATGLKQNKFGIDFDSAEAQYLEAKSLSHVEIVGVDCHIGSQVTEISPFVDALGRLRDLVERLARFGIHIRYLDLGGGLGITYADEEPPHPREYARALGQGLLGLDCRLIFEPGRVIVGNAGVLVTRVLYTKQTSVKRFVIVDAGMNDLVRPSLYDSYHQIQPVSKKQRPRVRVDVVGPICETGDFLAKDRELVEPEPGDLLAVMSAGAYGFVMASNYNSRPRPPEVMVKDDEFATIRCRETVADLVRGETLPEFLG
ncbi:MAG: diaminopimelate decarboxylase [Deltaproteobacteria bacterium]|nr:diaminopimelate decarboxylase [Deltaproteobacteria bacterium]MBW2071909.1 diaminopimelate decarboxylase [Deltaproteobacteria bacterium]